MAEKVNLLINVSFALSLAALGAAAAVYLFRERIPRRLLPGLLGAAWLALTAALALLWARLGRPPLSNQYESLLTMLWFVAPLSLYYYRRFPVPEALWPAAFASPVILGVASLLDRTARPLMPALRSDWLIFHVLASMAAYAAFALAAVAGAAALARRRCAEDEELLLRLTKAGFAALTLGIASGSVWAETAWGAWWSWDPKETWSLLTWLAYAAALHLRRQGWRAHKFAIILMACFALVLFTYFGVNFLLSGMHSYA
jgi:ABC-type transport system involved in cytochrome c biogenesis permease subunit